MDVLTFVMEQLRSCWDGDPAKRPTMMEVIHHLVSISKNITPQLYAKIPMILKASLIAPLPPVLYTTPTSLPMIRMPHMVKHISTQPPHKIQYMVSTTEYLIGATREGALFRWSLAPPVCFSICMKFTKLTVL